jgi:hypothetical protein
MIINRCSLCGAVIYSAIPILLAVTSLVWPFAHHTGISTGYLMRGFLGFSIISIVFFWIGRNLVKKILNSRRFPLGLLVWTSLWVPFAAAMVWRIVYRIMAIGNAVLLGHKFVPTGLQIIGKIFVLDVLYLLVFSFPLHIIYGIIIRRVWRREVCV